MLPVLTEGRAKDGEDAKDGGEEDGTAPADVTIKRVRQPAAQKRRTHVRRPVDKAEDPLMLLIIWCSLHWADAELCRE